MSTTPDTWTQYAHDDADCHGTRCKECGCCMHSKYCMAEFCRDRQCGCSL